ncbi:MAG: hypothetical protein O7G87_06315, partial [bacterium]|nr:hypothetical protein [bacterium]
MGPNHFRKSPIDLSHQKKPVRSKIDGLFSVSGHYRSALMTKGDRANSLLGRRLDDGWHRIPAEKEYKMTTDSSWAQGWEQSYNAGYYDRNGKYAGGSEIMHLAPHKGKL